MKFSKPIKTISIVILILIMVSAISFYTYFYLTLNYDEQITEHYTEDVIVINDLFVSMYLIKSDSGYIAIDTGFFPLSLRKD